MNMNKIRSYNSIVDLVLVSRKAAIDQMGFYDKVPTDEVEVSKWISKILRQYLKKYFPGCYIRKNKYAFSIRLDTDMYRELIYFLNPSLHRLLRTIEDRDLRAEIEHLSDTVNDALNRFNFLNFKQRSDGVCFIYVAHTPQVYRTFKKTFYTMLCQAENFESLFSDAYDRYTRLKPIIEEMQNRVENEESSEDNSSQNQEPDEQLRPLNVEDTRTNQAVELTRVEQPTPVSSEAQRRFEEALRRATGDRNTENRPVLRPVEENRVIVESREVTTDDFLRPIFADDDDDELAITLEPSVASVDLIGGVIRKWGSLQYFYPDYFQKLIDGYVKLDSFSEYDTVYDLEQVNDTIKAIENIDLPKDIPCTSTIFDNEYVYDVSSDIEDSLVYGPDGVYYTPEPIYYIVAYGKIIGKSKELKEAQGLYESIKNEKIDCVFYPVTEVNLTLKKMLNFNSSIF